jgi:hypothetical protein
MLLIRCPLVVGNKITSNTVKNIAILGPVVNHVKPMPLLKGMAIKSKTPTSMAIENGNAEKR